MAFLNKLEVEKTAEVAWSEKSIGRALALDFFERKYLAVPNCNWTGYEADLLIVTEKLRLIDVEIKISRGDLKADAKKGKWREWVGCPTTDAHPYPYVRIDKDHPRKVWKHYYALPKEIWCDSLIASLPSEKSGILLLSNNDGQLRVECRRLAKPNKNADAIAEKEVVHIARLANLRMWNAYKKLDEAA